MSAQCRRNPMFMDHSEHPIFDPKGIPCLWTIWNIRFSIPKGSHIYRSYGIKGMRPHWGRIYPPPIGYKYLTPLGSYVGSMPKGPHVYGPFGTSDFRSQ